MDMNKILKKQRQFYNKGKTRTYEFRWNALNRLERTVKKYERQLEKALQKDLHKSSFETYMTETGMLLSEIRYLKKHLKKWMRAKAVPSPVAQFPSKSFQVKEPYGVVLIMAPWNYPVLLSLEPLAGAIAAGNCCMIKTSEYAPAASGVIQKIINEAFPECYVAVITGGREENRQLLDKKFDYIFFTGGTTVGKLVMEKAAKHLTPVTLELGGKSPCIVDATANLKLAAKRIVFGKFLNSGQTCVAPDYILVDQKVENELTRFLIYWIRKMYGREPLSNPNYPCMVNQRHYQRVMKLIRHEDIVEGGYGDAVTKQISPTILRNVKKTAPVMQEEIFGPVLPILSYEKIEDACALIQSKPKPLALYLFTTDKAMESYIMRKLSFGGGCINDTIIHLATSAMGFGGVGESGMGAYHGKDSFDTFTHKKSIVKKSNRLDLPVRYMPYCTAKKYFIKLFL